MATFARSRLPRWLLAVPMLAALGGAASARELAPLTADVPEAAGLIERLRQGGLVLFFRHGDTRGMPCDRVFAVGRREGQRNLSPDGRGQAARIGRRMAELGIPIALPVLAGPVYRARDTAELAFGAERVRVIAGLTADDFAGAQLQAVLAEHRRLTSEPVAPGVNRVLIGHRTPAIMVLGPAVGGRALPEGGAIVLAPRPEGAPEILGIVEFAPLPGGGFHAC